MLAGYHLRLALRSVRRDPGLSATIVVVMALAAAIFCTALMHYLRMYLEESEVAPGLHQVEIPVPLDGLRTAFEGSNAEPNIMAARSRVSYPMYRLLSASGVPARETGTFRSRALLRLPDDPDGRAPLRPRNVRFVNADFFSMFARRLRWGAAWSRQDEAGGARVAVVARDLAEQLWGGADPVGRTLLVDGNAFRVVGALADEPPFTPEWDRVVTGGPQDVIYLPFAEHARLHARPEVPVMLAPPGPRYEDLLKSSTVFVAYWADLPTPEARARYARYLADTLEPRGISFTLRDLATFRAELVLPKTVLSFFLVLTFIVLVGGGLVTTRLLLAKGVARRGELSIFRALGAPRGALLAQQLMEAAVLSATGGGLALPIAAGLAFFYNRNVADTDIPLVLTPAALAITFLATVGVGVVCALYPGWRAASRRPTSALVRS